MIVECTLYSYANITISWCTLSQPLTYSNSIFCFRAFFSNSKRVRMAALTLSKQLSNGGSFFYLWSKLNPFTRFLCPLYLAMFWQTYNCQTCFVIDVQCLPMPYMRPGFYFCAVTIYEAVNPWPETTHTLFPTRAKTGL